MAFTVVGVFCTIAALGTFGNQVKFVKSSDRFAGVVVDNVTSRDSDNNGAMYAPLEKYIGTDGMV